jgi:hypothetical protein
VRRRWTSAGKTGNRLIVTVEDLARLRPCQVSCHKNYIFRFRTAHSGTPPQSVPKRLHLPNEWKSQHRFVRLSLLPLQLTDVPSSPKCSTHGHSGIAILLTISCSHKLPSKALGPILWTTTTIPIGITQKRATFSNAASIQRR